MGTVLWHVTMSLDGLIAGPGFSKSAACLRPDSMSSDFAFFSLSMTAFNPSSAEPI